MQREQPRRSRCSLVCLFVYLLARSLACLLALLPACLLACLLACSSENVGGRGLLAALARDENQKPFAAAARDVLAPHTRFRLGNARETMHMPQHWGIHTRQLLLNHTSARGTHGLQFRPQNHVNWINYMKIYMSTPPLPTEPTKRARLEAASSPSKALFDVSTSKAAQPQPWRGRIAI